MNRWASVTQRQTFIPGRIPMKNLKKRNRPDADEDVQSEGSQSRVQDKNQENEMQDTKMTSVRKTRNRIFLSLLLSLPCPVECPLLLSLLFLSSLLVASTFVSFG